MYVGMYIFYWWPLDKFRASITYYFNLISNMLDQLQGISSLASWSNTITQHCGKVYVISCSHKQHAKMTKSYYDLCNIFLV